MAHAGNTVQATGGVTAPTANQGIVNIAAVNLPAGSWQIDITIYLSAGTPAAADTDNAYLAWSTHTNTLPLPPTLNAPVQNLRYYIYLDGATAVGVNAAGAGTAGVTYRVSLRCTRLSS